MHSTLLIICISERTDSLNHVNETFLYFTRTTCIFVLFLRSIQEIDWTKIFPPLFQFIFISQAILHYMFYKSMNIFLSPYTSRNESLHAIEDDDNTWISIASSGLIDRSSQRTSSTICRIFFELRSFASTWIVSLNFICYAWNTEQVIKSMWTIIKL